MGLQYNGSGCEWAHATTESILLNIPCGPLDIGIAFYPFRFAGTSSNRASPRSENPIAQTPDLHESGALNA